MRVINRYFPGRVHSVHSRLFGIFTIFGANTDVGKTIVSSAILSKCPSATYIKPIQTGYPIDSDSEFIKLTTNVKTTTLFKFKDKTSPHSAASKDDRVSDNEFIKQLENVIISNKTIIEMAGGVLSPGISGNLQSNIMRKLRLPVILVADSNLGGISTTITAYESLKIRGFEVPFIFIFETKHKNQDIIKQHVNSTIIVIKAPPKKHKDKQQDISNMKKYLNELDPNLHLLKEYSKKRRLEMVNLKNTGKDYIWWPFTQHNHVKNPLVIDSAYKDFYSVFDPVGNCLNRGFMGQELRVGRNDSGSLGEFRNDSGSLGDLKDHYANRVKDYHVNRVKGYHVDRVPGDLKDYYDASASWWTNGLGHGNPKLALTAAYAAGRYGHVISPESIHEPMQSLAKELLKTAGDQWAARVFYSDNGSTAIEVALKMAFGKANQARVRAVGEVGAIKVEIESGKGGTEAPNVGVNSQWEVIGFKDSYHGDTIGAMDASSPNSYNERVDWYKGRGFWFNPPTVKYTNGKYKIDIPKEFNIKTSNELLKDTLDEVFYHDRPKTAHAYKLYITNQLEKEIIKGKRFGALIIEPIIQGAGGMLFIDPLFQKTLIEVVREPETFGYDFKIPVVFDEVFVGMYRLGPSYPSVSSLFKGVYPDIACYAKSLTGGLLPLAVTLTTKEIFQVFEGDEKIDALLHGHSYTAHPIGCAVALESLREYRSMQPYQDKWSAFNQEVLAC
jgi:dethiobiotin synthetase/adenosylmethionine--8-amino-7-oxononanoate aminotransferase